MLLVIRAAQIVDQIVATDDFKAFDGKNPYALVSALSDAFLRTDDALRAAHTDGTADETGATGLVVLVTEHHIISANVGTSNPPPHCIHIPQCIQGILGAF